MKRALACAVVGIVLCVVGAVAAPARMLAGYLAVWAAALSLVLGALAMNMIAPLTGAGWYAPFRPYAGRLTAALPVLALGFLPIAFGLRLLYPWMHPASLAPAAAEAVAAKRAWFEPAFFLARAAAYFVLWIALAALLERWDPHASEIPSVGAVRRERVLSALGLPPYGFAVTFAAIDWLMSLRPSWSSTIFGAYWFAGGMTAALAALALIAAAAPSGDTRPATPVRSFHQLGKLLLCFVVFWAYMAYSQYLIIWIADVPSEVAWYLPRSHGSWGAVSLLLLFGHFVVPGVLLLFRAFKRRPAALAALGAWLVLMHWVDTWWLVLPELEPGAARPHWTDLAALVAVGGLVAASAVWWGRRTEAERAAAGGEEHGSSA